MSKLVVIGTGRVGTLMAMAFQSIGHQVIAGVCRHPDSHSARRFSELTRAAVLPLTQIRDCAFHADVLVISVPDKAVTLVAQTLAEQEALHEGQIVVHTAGALPSEILVGVAESGAAPVSMHPLQTIADPSVGTKLLQGVVFTLEGHRESVTTLSEWIRAFGGVPVAIEAIDRPRYHAAAVLASNAIVALAAVAADLSGLPDGLQALLPLLQGSVSNLARVGLPTALTGPVERGDVSTIAAHIQAIQDNPTALTVYLALGDATAELALRKGSITPDQRTRFGEMFRISRT